MREGLMLNFNKEKKVDPNQPKKYSKEYWKKELWSWIYIFFIVFGFRSTFIDHYHIPTGSLLPTNAIGDSIVVNKMSYGFKLPFSEYFGTVSSWFGVNSDKRWTPVYLTEQSLPKRGDIAVFEYPIDPSILFVKRIIAIEGDTVEVYENELFINGKKVERKKIENDSEYRELYDPKPPYLNPSEMVFYEQKIGEKKFVSAVNSSPYARHIDQDKVTVPKDHVFAMGDNRDFSSDSRVWGFVHKKYIRGRAFTVWMSVVYPWSPEPFHFRPSRIGTML